MSAIDTADGFKLGDIVWVGEPGDLMRKVTWQIMSLHRADDTLTYATLTSGQTGRMMTTPTSRLSKFRAVETA